MMITTAIIGVVGILVVCRWLPILILTKGCHGCTRRIFRWDNSICCVERVPGLWKHDPHYEWDKDDGI